MGVELGLLHSGKNIGRRCWTRAGCCGRHLRVRGKTLIGVWRELHNEPGNLHISPNIITGHQRKGEMGTYWDEQKCI